MIAVILAVMTLFEEAREGHTAKITLSDTELRLNEPLQVVIETEPPLDDIFPFKRAFMAPSSRGMIPLFLTHEEKQENRWLLTYMPQAPGSYTVRLPPITWEGFRMIPPLAYLSIENSPRYEDEPLEPAPPLPLEPGEPLELDEQNRKLLAEISKADRPSAALEERQFPWVRLASLLLFFAVLPFLAALHTFLNRPIPKKPLSKEEALELLKRIPQSKGKQSLDQLHHLMCQALNPRFASLTAKEIAAKDIRGDVIRFFTHLEEARFRQSNPETEPLFTAAEQLL